MDLTIVIVSWNASQLLFQCLNSIYGAGSRFSFETIVVDNGSSDDSVAIIEKHFSNVILIKNEQNCGFSRANNQALVVGKGRYYLFLNSDTIVLPGTLDALIELADENPQVGVVGPRLLNLDGSLQRSWYSFPGLISEMRGQYFGQRRPVKQMPHVYDVDWILGACMLVKAEVIDDVGKMDEDYFFYSEEADWCYRIKKKNWKIWYLENVEIYHLGGGSTLKGSFVQLVNLYQGKLLFFKKNYGNFWTTVLRYGLAFVNTLGIIRRLIFLDWRNRESALQRIESQSRLVWCLLKNQFPATNL